MSRPSPLGPSDTFVGGDADRQAAAIGERSRAAAAVRKRREQLFEWSVRLASLLLILGLWEFYGRRVNKALFAPPLSLIHISEPTRLGMISYAVFCLKKKKKT